MPRSFLIKKKGKSEKRIDEIIRAFAKKEIHDSVSRPVVTEPVLSAVTPYTPALVQPIQPLAVRLCNGKNRLLNFVMVFTWPLFFTFFSTRGRFEHPYRPITVTKKVLRYHLFFVFHSKLGFRPYLS